MRESPAECGRVGNYATIAAEKAYLQLNDLGLGKNCYKVKRNIVTKKDIFFVTKWDWCYKVRWMLLQIGTGVTKWDD